MLRRVGTWARMALSSPWAPWSGPRAPDGLLPADSADLARRQGADDPQFEPHDDEHPEYVADEFLSLAEGPGGDLVESRTPGRTGTYGWTVREGFARDVLGSRAAGGASGGRRGAAGSPGRTGQAPREGID